LAAHDKVLLLAVPFVLVASYLYQPLCHDGPVICSFRAMTGLPCPGCGLTRSFCEIARGNITAALAMHPLGPAVFLYLAWFVFSRLRLVFTGYSLPKVSGRLYWAVAIVLMAQHVIRLGVWCITQPNYLRDNLSAGLIVRTVLHIFRG